MSLKFWQSNPIKTWEQDINTLAGRHWQDGKDISRVLIYISPFGEHKVLPCDYEHIDDAIAMLMDEKNKLKGAA